MGLKTFTFDGQHKLDLAELPTSAKGLGLDREEIEEMTRENLKAISLLQDKLYADSKEAVVMLLQAMDAAGKDSTIKHVMGGVNPQGIVVHSFKQPTGEEMAHDYLWRAVKALPPRGGMAIFNRSYYEDVLVVRVHELYKSYQMAKRCLGDADDFFQKRYQQIRHFEEYLYENSYRVVKIFLNVSKKEQKKRFLERIDIPAKNWKFSQADIKERGHWDAYMKAYQQTINNTATKHSPWYVLPADNKWYTRYLVSQIMRHTLESVDPQYPQVPQAKLDELLICKQKLMEEDGGPGPETDKQ